MKLSEQLKYFREQRGYSRADVARIAGINYSTYNGYEIENKNPSIGNLTKIAKALSVSMDQLLFTDYIDPLDELKPIIEEAGFNVSSVISSDGSQEIVELIYKNGGSEATKIIFGQSVLIFEKENFINSLKELFDKINKEYECQKKERLKAEIFKQIISAQIDGNLAPLTLVED